MFTNREKRLIDNPYFSVIRETDSFIEFQSKNTKHCWIIHRHSFQSSLYPLIIYHKHTIKTEYYHKHWTTYTVAQAISSIKNHDEYVLKYQYH